MSLFELEAVGGPWALRLRRRRAGFDALPWGEAAAGASPEALDSARLVWTRSAFSEYASAAAFAEIAACLLSAGAPIDLVAAAGDFVVDEVLHAELSARVAMSLGGAVALEVNLERLVRPPVAVAPLMRAAELLVRTSCVGEALTVPILKASKDRARSPLIKAVIARRIALKTVRGMGSPWRYQLKNEFRSVAGVAHPNLVALYEFVADEDDWYFTMEFIEGVSFVDYVAAVGDDGAVTRMVTLSTAVVPGAHESRDERQGAGALSRSAGAGGADATLCRLGRARQGDRRGVDGRGRRDAHL